MSKLVKTAEEQIVSSVTAAIKSNIADGTFVETEIPDFKTEIPADRKNGDYSANGAFLLSKTLRMPPRKIAEHILEKINLEQLADVEKHARVNGASIVNLIYVGAVAA